MNNIGYDIAKTFISQKKYEALVEFSKIENPDKPGIISSNCLAKYNSWILRVKVS